MFRDPTDQGETRQKPTPSPSVINLNLSTFLEQWKGHVGNGKPVITASTEREVLNLRKHVDKGCLSGIKPGRGTNRNEALHKYLNMYTKSSKYGVELANMILTSFYQHNELISAKKEKHSPKLLMKFQQELRETPVTEKFGLIQSSMLSGPENLSADNSDISILSFDQSSYSDIVERLYSSDVSFEGIDEDGSLAIVNAVDILLRAIGWYTIYTTMSKYTTTALLSCTDIPFMRENFGYILMWQENLTDSNHSGAEALANVLDSWNFSKVEIPGDGNCLFTAVALYLETVYPSLPSSHPRTDIINSLGVTMGTSSTTYSIIDALRKVVVQEWLGQNSQYYTGFLSSVQLEHEAARFLDNGEFTGELGDLVIAALSNVLQSPIVVFTSIQNLPVLVITPSHHVMNNPSPIHLAYCHDGPGHYDLAVHCSDTSDKDQTQHKQCTCGRKNPQSIGAACTTVLNKYASRCPCYNSRQACTDLCKCKNCANEFGVASTIGTTAI